MSKKGVYVVTLPELGWDCVVSIFDASTCTEEEVKFMYGEDYVISYKTFQEVERPKEVDESQIREIEDKYDTLLLCIIDVLEIEYDSLNLLYSKEGKKLQKPDQHILGQLFKNFLKEKDISDQGGEIVVVNNPKYSYLGMLFPNELSIDLFDKSTWWEFKDYLRDEKRIDIG